MAWTTLSATGNISGGSGGTFKMTVKYEWSGTKVNVQISFSGGETEGVSGAVGASQPWNYHTHAHGHIYYKVGTNSEVDFTNQFLSSDYYDPNCSGMFLYYSRSGPYGDWAAYSYSGSITAAANKNVVIRYYFVDSVTHVTLAGSNNSISVTIPYSSATPTTYTVSYNRNGGNQEPTPVTVNVGSSMTLHQGIIHSNILRDNEYVTIIFNPQGGECFKTNIFIQNYDSYVFNGWHEGSPTGTNHQPSTSFTPTSTITLYAGWNVTYVTPTTNFPSIIECVKHDYTLLGWSTSSTATTPTYLPGAELLPTPSQYGETITYYAVWAPINTNFIEIYDNTDNRYHAYDVYIYNGSTWELYDAYYYDNSTWNVCGGDPYATFITSDNNEFLESASKTLKVWHPDGIEL